MQGTEYLSQIWLKILFNNETVQESNEEKITALLQDSLAYNVRQ
jgi:hypothetical protein